MILHNFLSILAVFGWIYWCDFGRTDFWKVKRRQMRLSWKFSLLNRYFSTTLLYQFFFDRTFFHILFFYAYFLKHFGCIWLILLMRFWQIIFLKRQMTSDEAEIFFFITNQILLHNFALSDFNFNDFQWFYIIS